MKGLLYKDWALIAGGYKTNFLFLLVFYGLLTVVARMTFLAYAMVFVVGMYASSTISMDENSRWDAYAHTLPVTPGQLVAVKYWLTLILTAASIPLSFCLIALIPDPKPTHGNRTGSGCRLHGHLVLLFFRDSPALQVRCRQSPQLGLHLPSGGSLRTGRPLRPAAREHYRSHQKRCLLAGCHRHRHLV